MAQQFRRIRLGIACTLACGLTASCGSDDDSSGTPPGPSPSTNSSSSATIAAGFSHSCTVTAAGALKCWGSNSYGQLGDGSTTDSALPVQVSGLASGVRAVAVGEVHTCALTSQGGVKCWGSNSSGQLGQPERTPVSEPVEIEPLVAGVTGIAAGEQFTCAILTDGSVKCWGDNSYGQLGNGTTEDTSIPIAVKGLSNVRAIAAGGSHVCALTSAGGVKCWGDAVEETSPVDVFGLDKGVAGLTAGNGFTCAIMDTGDALCWGENGSGQLGNGKYRDSTSPVPVLGLTANVVQISAKGEHACALTKSGGVKCWGSSSSGQLGHGSTLYPDEPVDVSGLTAGVAAIGVGDKHSCAVLASGAVKCWGNNTFGQLGNGDPLTPGKPVAVTGLASGVASVSAGSAQSCAVTTGGAVKCWGRNESGSLGSEATWDSYVPIAVTGLAAGMKSVSVGDDFACAMSTAGALKCWGNNYSGQLATTTEDESSTPLAIAGLTVKTVATGRRHACALTTAGAVKCWGDNGYGQLGNNTTDSATTPVDVSGLSSGVKSISAGKYHSCAVTSAGGVKCWGGNEDQQLGNGGTDSSTVPVDVTGLTSGVVAISVSASHGCALTTTNGVKCWGNNDQGQLGNGNTSTQASAVDVVGLSSGVSAISSGGDGTYSSHTCALTSTGAVKCWGANDSGELGNGGTQDSSSPVDVMGLSAGVRSLASGAQHTCAVNSSGGVLCWGDNGNGQLGKLFLTPVDVRL